MQPDSKHAAAATDAHSNRARQFKNQLSMILRRCTVPKRFSEGEEMGKPAKKKGSPLGLPAEKPQSVLLSAWSLSACRK
jgi:hypothetical protein